jgi:hypothetical protein
MGNPGSKINPDDKANKMNFQLKLEPIARRDNLIREIFNQRE